jgi:hypothetical protein
MDLVQMGFALLVVSSISGSLWFGVYRGKMEERKRVQSLIHSALQVRHSGSLCWVLNAVNSGELKLMSEERFFSSEKPKAEPTA